ncbi:MAG TPA: extracellular solute-binding protein [Terriglobales bacterium]|jgi:iron(III) transport system substrate-binding protein|nr:extracellular solute-binding protein [Terriglobales bacterium]
MFARLLLVAAMVLLTGLAASAWAQSFKPTTIADLAKYNGADRARVLYDGAKKEGKFLWYTSLIANKEIVKIFESKYPGVTVETYRASGTQLASRVLAEAQSKRYLGDVIETSPPGLMVLRDSQLLLPYASPFLADYPEAAWQKAPNGLTFWTTDRESYIGVGYNKTVLPAGDVPKNFDDLLRPALKSKLAISNDDVAARFVGGMIKAKGDAFVKKLKDQDIKVHALNGPGFNELIVSGEVPISFTAIHSNIGHAADKGAPVAWVPMELVPAISGGIALFSHAQHPYGALLLVDFLLSPEGQKMLIETFKHGSATKDYGFKRWYPEEGSTTSQYDQTMDKWQKLVSEFMRR